MFMHLHMPFPTLVGNAAYVASLAALALLAWLCARRLPAALLPICAGFLSVLQLATALAHHLGIFVLIWTGGLNLRTRCLPFLISYRSPYPRTTHAPEANRVRSRAGGTTNGDKATKAMSTTQCGWLLGSMLRV